MRNALLTVLAAAVASVAPAQDLPLLSEICVTPTGGEFVEIYNPSPTSSVDLEEYYLCDLYGTSATVTAFYPQLVAGPVTSNSADFLVQFPPGSSLAPGQVATIAMNGTDFQTAYGIEPDYHLLGTGGVAMIIPANGFIGSTAGLTNGDEVVMLFFWDGSTDRTYDVDYALWGDDTTRRVDKTGISLDGPDGDTVPTPYLTETAPASQDPISLAAHGSGFSYQRVDFTEGLEVKSGGNGLTGHDETSENMSDTWVVVEVTPGVIYTSLSRNTWGEIKSLYGE